MGSIPSEENLDLPSLPPFPSDVPTVPLRSINLQNLLNGSEKEQDLLWRACTELGFFYLDLRPSPQDVNTGHGSNLLKTSDALFSLGTKIFNLPDSEKQTYDMQSQDSYFGYKGLGAGVIDSKGTKDRNEFWNISKDDILNHTDPLPNPEILQEQVSRELLESFMRSSHAVVTLILQILNTKLGLPDSTLQDLHRLDSVSGDQVRWVKSPPQPRDDRATALGEHTDFGSVTVLFNRLGGLQVLPPGEGEGWKYVKPLRGHCVVNLGDAMVKFTRGILRSNVSCNSFVGRF
jgi:isopenicillin N synthase-like dioxygenase